MFKGIYWKGRGIVIPGAYSYVNADNMTPDRLSPANVIAAIGPAKGGPPQTATRVTSLKEAAALLRSGDLKTAAEFMYDPSSEVPGAGEVLFMRVNSAVASTAAIGALLNLTAKDWGEHTNFLRYKIETGSVSGRKLTFNHQLDDLTEVADNLGPIFNLRYVGTEATAVCKYNRTTHTFSVEAPAATSLVSYDVTAQGLTTIKALVSVLDSHPDLECVVNKYGNPSMLCTALDTIASGDIHVDSPNWYIVTAEVGAALTWINSNSSLLSAGLGATPTGNFTNANWVNFSGGSEGAAPTTSDYVTCLAKLEAESDVSIVYLASGTEAIHLAGQQHCELMADIKTGKERVLICGGASGETVEQVTTRAQNQGSKRTVLVYPEAKRYNLTTGNLDTIDPYLVAAMVAGMAAGVTPETPLTFKTLKVQGMGKYITNTETEQLLNQGVLPVWYDQNSGIYQIVQAITTWQKDANVIWRKLSGIRIHDYLRQELRNTARRFIGQVADAVTMIQIKNAVSAKLDLLTRTSQNPQGVLTPVITNLGEEPAWTDLVVSYDGLDWVQISVKAHPVGEIAYITLEAVLEPAKMTV